MHALRLISFLKTVAYCQVEVLKQLKESELLTMADAMQEAICKEGDVVCRQGDAGAQQSLGA